MSWKAFFSVVIVIYNEYLCCIHCNNIVCNCYVDVSLVLQVALAAVLSVAYGENTGQTTMGIVAMMHVITKSQAVPETATPGIVLHAIKTVAMLFGAISWGGRLAPVTGMPCILSWLSQFPSA